MPAKTWMSRRLLLRGLAATLLLLIAAFALGKPLLTIERGPAQADVIVVLGGESELRAARALELYQAGAAKSVIVSGDGHKGDIETFLLRNGVPPSVIQLEPSSRNTKENAEFTCAILRSNDVKKAIIVTSWYHSRRALSCFQEFGSTIQFSSLPTLQNEPFSVGAVHLLKEYVKVIGYVFRYQIFPWT